MKIAIIGTGISGNVAAYHLSRDHDLTVYEAGDHVGGHTHTHTIDREGKQIAVDSGFIVFNRETYPNFVRLLDELGVQAQATTMGFSVKSERNGLEYSGSGASGLFAQRRNLLRPGFWSMVHDILRFFREAPALLQSWDESLTLGDYLRKNRYGREFIDHYIIPMGAAIWSTDPERMLTFPACYFVRFFRNHGLLGVNDHLQWYVIKGGSRTYVDRLTAPFRGRIRLRCPVVSVRRFPSHVRVRSADGHVENFDHVLIATHSDQALRMLEDASPLEREILGAIPYQRNEAVLHTDHTLLPQTRRAWAAWNYHILARHQDHAALTYNMNILQGLPLKETLCVTLNHTDAIDPDRIIKRMYYDHPLYTPAGVAAQARHAEVNGMHRTWFAGAYWGHGFHEDGVVSALRAIEHFRERAHAQLPLRRAS
jgi:predicted NAD/FAD-binding protein